MKIVELYTDGSCLGNPGTGGYAYILKYKHHKKIVSEGYSNTTNNRMELMAVIKGLLALKEHCIVTVYTDSRYVQKGITEWILNWKNNGWKTATKQDVKNKDLWEVLDNLSNQHNITWEWIKGHSNNTINNECDNLAREAAKGFFKNEYI